MNDGSTRSRGLASRSANRRVIGYKALFPEHVSDDLYRYLRDGLIPDQALAVQPYHSEQQPDTYVPAFSAPGPLTAIAFPTPLHNTTGKARIIARISVGVGAAPSGMPLEVDVLKDGAPFASVSVPAGSTFATSDVLLPWAIGEALTVTVVQASGAADLVVQVVIA